MVKMGEGGGERSGLSYEGALQGVTGGCERWWCCGVGNGSGGGGDNGGAR